MTTTLKSLLLIFSIVSAICLPVLAQTPPPVKSHASKPQIWNLQNANIRAVIAEISKLTGKSFIVDPAVKGKISIISSKPMRPQEAYQVFLSMLQVLGFAAVPNGNVIKVVPTDNAKTYNSLIANRRRPGKGDQMVVRVISTHNIPAARLVPVLRPLMPQGSSATAYNPTNVLILAGRANNVQRLAKVVRQINAKNGSHIQVINLRHASASKVKTILSSLESAEHAAGKVVNVSIAADEQTNSIILSGNTQERLRLARLISELDSPSANGSGNTSVIHLNYLKAKKLAPILAKIAHAAYASKTSKTLSNSDMNRKVSIQAEPASNSIIISAPPAMLQNLKHVIHKVDIRPKQVLVEAIIAEVDEQEANKLGITWGSSPENGINNGNGSSLSFNTGTAGLSGAFRAGIGILRTTALDIPGFTSPGLQAVISALMSDSSADILSTPSIVVINNQKAVISVGKTISIENRTYALNNTQEDSFTPFTTLERQNIGLQLTVTPQISPNKQVRMTIEQINDSLENPELPSTRPIENTSKIQTSVMVKNGDILVLGGLISHQLENSRNSIPILGKIPLLGNLFKFRDKRVEKKELLIFLRPIILDDQRTSQQITAQNYNFIRQQQLMRYHGHNLINRKTQTPLLPPMRSPHVAIPSPF